MNNKISIQPLVSVVMSIFNGEKYLSDAIQSILNQTYQNWELIIINDGSTDNTETVIKKYSDKRIRYVFHENIGLTKSLNKGILMSQGEYIARLDYDDRAFPERIEKQVDYFSKNPNLLVLGTSYYKFDAQTMVGSIVQTSLNDLGCRKRLKLGASPFMHSSVMFKKQVNGKIVLYNENFKEAQDVRLWITLLSKGEGAVLPDILCYILSYHSESISSNRNPLTRVEFQWNFAKIANHELNGNFYNLCITCFILMKVFLAKSVKPLFINVTNFYPNLKIMMKPKKINDIVNVNLLELWNQQCISQIILEKHGEENCNLSSRENNTLKKLKY